MRKLATKYLNYDTDDLLYQQLVNDYKSIVVAMSAMSMLASIKGRDENPAPGEVDTTGYIMAQKMLNEGCRWLRYLNHDNLPDMIRKRYDELERRKSL